jgi:hypothetical protein
MTVSSYHGFIIGGFPPKFRPMGTDGWYSEKPAPVSFLEQHIPDKGRKLRFCGLNTRRYASYIKALGGSQGFCSVFGTNIFTG